MVIHFLALVLTCVGDWLIYVNFLQIKTGDVRALANTSFLLVKKNWSSEIRLHAYKMLQVQFHLLCFSVISLLRCLLLLPLIRKRLVIQHLVRLRWEELSPAEHKNFANLSLDLMSEIADPCENWALKSQTAALVAEVFIAILPFFIIVAILTLSQLQICLT